MNETEAFLLAAAVMAIAGWHVDDVKQINGQWVVVANRAGTIVRLKSPQEWVTLVWKERMRELAK